RIYIAARARAHDHRDLRDHAGRHDVALEHVAVAASAATPSWMRAPPASNRPTIGARAFMAMSWILVIFWAWVSDSEPPNTVKSLAQAKTVRPLTVPQPVTTPSPGILVFAMPNSVARC